MAIENVISKNGVFKRAPMPESSGGVLIATITEGTLDKTWQEIVDAMSTTGAVLVQYDDGAIVNIDTFKHADKNEKFSEYIVRTGDGIMEMYVASSASGYPVQQSE